LSRLEELTAPQAPWLIKGAASWREEEGGDKGIQERRGTEEEELGKVRSSQYLGWTDARPSSENCWN